jgi:hypothetical protein
VTALSVDNENSAIIWLVTRTIEHAKRWRGRVDAMDASTRGRCHRRDIILERKGDKS